jgi:hypothetical protein
VATLTRNIGFKRLVRRRAGRTGESYSTARAYLQRRGARADAELVALCAMPIVRRLYSPGRGASNLHVSNLNRQQGALLAFWIVFSHAKDGLAGLCRGHAHRLRDTDFWTLLEIGLREHAELAAVIAGLRAEVSRAVAVSGGHDEFGWLEHLDAVKMRELEAEFEAATPVALHRMANGIRSEAERFAIAEAAL